MMCFLFKTDDALLVVIEATEAAAKERGRAWLEAHGAPAAWLTDPEVTVKTFPIDQPAALVAAEF